MTETRQAKIDRMNSLRQPNLAVILEDIHDPHNAAAILRSCDAFGVGNVHYIFETEQYYNPKKIGKESSSSANKWLNIHTSRSTEQCLTELKSEGYTLISTILNESAESLLSFSFSPSPRIALLLGNEHRGLSQKAIEMSDHHLYLPMRGMVQSLNVSVTAGICLFEITRQLQINNK